MNGLASRRQVRAVRAGVIAAAVVCTLALSALLGAGDVAAGATFASDPYRYSVALPEGCRYEEGPGTIDAICAPEFDTEHSARADSARAVVMKVGVELLAAEAGGNPNQAQAFTEVAFREELPQAVCGESDPARARIANARKAVEEDRVVYTAEVICAEVRFLQIAERRAAVRYVIGPEARYRLIARAPIEEFEKHKQAIAAFFDSFRILPAENKAPR